ncbi:unnamed protein product [Somion occarium]
MIDNTDPSIPSVASSLCLKVREISKAVEEPRSTRHDDHRAPSSVNLLPPELLGAIFHSLVLSYAATELEEEGAQCPYSWAYIAQVCRYWRDVALQSPILWSYILLDKSVKPDTLSEALLRSGRVPLSLRAWLPVQTDASPEFTSCLKRMSEELHRLWSIKVRIPSREIPIVMESFVDTYPLLRSLTVRSNQVDLFFPATQTSLQSGVQFPSLQRLELPDCVLDQVNTFIAGHATLRHLHITQFEDMPSMHAFLVALASVPLLETLKLTPGPAGDQTSERPAMPTVMLSRLQHLSLWFNFPCDVAFLDQLCIPSSTSIDATIKSFSSSTMESSLDAINSIASKLSGNGVIGAPPTLRSVKFEVNDTGGVTFIAQSEDWTDGAMPNFDTFQLRIALDGDRVQSPPMDRRWALWQQLPLSGLRAVSLGGRIDDEHWQQLVDYLGFIEVLQLCGTLTFASFVKPYFDTPTERAYNFPQLHTLFITTPISPEWMSIEETDLDRLQSYVDEMCRDNKHGLRRLEIHGSIKLSESRIATFRDLVGEFRYSHLENV